MSRGSCRSDRARVAIDGPRCSKVSTNPLPISVRSCPGFFQLHTRCPGDLCVSSVRFVTARLPLLRIGRRAAPNPFRIERSARRERRSLQGIVPSRKRTPSTGPAESRAATRFYSLIDWLKRRGVASRRSWARCPSARFESPAPPHRVAASSRRDNRESWRLTGWARQR